MKIMSKWWTVWLTEFTFCFMRPCWKSHVTCNMKVGPRVSGGYSRFKPGCSVLWRWFTLQPDISPLECLIDQSVTLISLLTYEFTRSAMFLAAFLPGFGCFVAFNQYYGCIFFIFVKDYNLFNWVKYVFPDLLVCAIGNLPLLCKHPSTSVMTRPAHDCRLEVLFCDTASWLATVKDFFCWSFCWQTALYPLERIVSVPETEI